MNLHVRAYRSTTDQWNFHIRYWGEDGLSEIWAWKNAIPGKSVDKDWTQEFGLMRIPLDWAATMAVGEMLRHMQQRMRVDYLFSITDEHGKSLNEALHDTLVALHDKG